ncbi:MAG: Tfx family DNA-binding protein [Thaumarchaeota archaeon]|nr:Tfx family DNA-binding protein [Nitrososphaerota archaeon]
MKLGLFNQKQYRILKLRAKGFTQLETAKELGISRANVSMIESRARKKIQKARETLEVYESLQSSHNIAIEKGSKLAEVPLVVLHEGDRHHVHVQSDLVEIVRMVRAVKPSCVQDGKVTRSLVIKMNERGKLTVTG